MYSLPRGPAPTVTYATHPSNYRSLGEVIATTTSTSIPNFHGGVSILTLGQSGNFMQPNHQQNPQYPTSFESYQAFMKEKAATNIPPGIHPNNSSF